MDIVYFINCTLVSEHTVNCNGTEYSLPEKVLTYEDREFWIYIGIYIALITFAGVMSGLTLGLLSLDRTTLITMRDGGTPRERNYATRILPVVKRHHLLLVTLLLSNSAAVEAMPIFLDRISNPIIAIIISVTAVFIFGEVLPQAVCTRYGLAIGAKLLPLVYFLMGAFFIISYPLAKLLDCCLGKDHGTFFRRAQLKALIDIHGEETDEEGGGTRVDKLTQDEVTIIKGCLDMKGKTARDAMLNIDEVFMLDITAKLDHETMSDIIERGHSRVPVFDTNRSNIVALLLTKTLIKLDPDDAVPVTCLVGDELYSRSSLFINSDMPLFDLLNLFQTGKSHLAVVQEAKQREMTLQKVSYHAESALLHVDTSGNAAVENEAGAKEVVGIISLEDVLEELLQEEIEDETDIMQEITGMLPFSRAKRGKNLFCHTRKFSSCDSLQASEFVDLKLKGDKDSLDEENDKQFKVTTFLRGMIPPHYQLYYQHNQLISHAIYLPTSPNPRY